MSSSILRVGLCSLVLEVFKVWEHQIFSVFHGTLGMFVLRRSNRSSGKRRSTLSADLSPAKCA